MFGPSDAGPGCATPSSRSCGGRACGSSPRPASRLGRGTPWRSKGMREGAAEMEARVARPCGRATRGGELEVVSDAASRTEGLVTSLAHVAESDSR